MTSSVDGSACSMQMLEFCEGLSWSLGIRYQQKKKKKKMMHQPHFVAITECESEDLVQLSLFFFSLH